MGFYHKWEELPEVQGHYLLEKIGKSPVARLISGAQVMVLSVKAPAGIPALMHYHEAEQMVIISKGKLKAFTKGLEPRIIGEGDIWVIPSNVPHGADILEDSEYLEICSPVRLDMLPGYVVSHTYTD